MHRSARSFRLSVPGATLHCETIGEGPLLLFIPGGALDAGAYGDLARELADRYTVVSFDPRGNSRSTLDDPPVDLRVEIQADDVVRIIDAMGGAPALVFGGSGGAQIALDVAARYPSHVDVVVAHEPPCSLLLDDPQDAVASDRRIHTAFLAGGVRGGIEAFMTESGMHASNDKTPASVAPDNEESRNTSKRVSANLTAFFAHGLLPLSMYEPDVHVLRQRSSRLEIGIGVDSAGLVTARTSDALARRLDITTTTFPGGHTGYTTHPAAFAAALDLLLSEDSDTRHSVTASTRDARR